MFRRESQAPAIRTAMTGAVCLLFVTAGLAAQAPQEQETVSSADVSEQELEQFTRGLNDVLEIQEELEPQLSSVQDPAQAQQLQQQANARMIEAIKAYGLDVDQYNLISRSLSEDPELNQRFQAMRQKLEELEEEEE